MASTAWTATPKVDAPTKGSVPVFLAGTGLALVSAIVGIVLIAHTDKAEIRVTPLQGAAAAKTAPAPPAPNATRFQLVPRIFGREDDRAFLRSTGLFHGGGLTLRATF